MSEIETEEANPDSVYISNLMDDFTKSRAERASRLGELYDFGDPNVLGHIFGDIITLLENVHILLNPPHEDGFESLMPKDADGSDAN
jgi:hypothetical protein